MIHINYLHVCCYILLCLKMRVPIAFDGGIITHEPDFRFMLLRHWSLYNAMFYSDYVGSQLQIWTAEGKQKLQRLLAQVSFAASYIFIVYLFNLKNLTIRPVYFMQIGIPLQDCKQQYSFMSDRMQKRLRDRIREPAERAGLEDIFFETFSLQVGQYIYVFVSQKPLAHHSTAIFCK